MNTTPPRPRTRAELDTLTRLLAQVYAMDQSEAQREQARRELKALVSMGKRGGKGVETVESVTNE